MTLDKCILEIFIDIVILVAVVINEDDYDFWY